MPQVSGISRFNRSSAFCTRRAGLLITVAAGITIWLARFPVAPLILGLILLTATTAVAWRPILLWVLIPAFLPFPDLAPWSGREYFDEFDALLALLSMAAWWRGPGSPPAQPDKLLRFVLAMAAASLFIGIARALHPWPDAEAAQQIALLSPFNALRISRGAAWAGFLYILLRRHQTAGWDVSRAFGSGMMIGLLSSIMVILAERSSFTNLLDFSDAYRVAGPFSAMHTGGAYVECFLVCALPFLLAWIIRQSGLLRPAIGITVAIAAVYAVAVTFSRGGLAALAFGLVLTPLLALAQRIGRGPRARLGLTVLTLALAAAWPVLTGSFAQIRFAAAGGDLLGRERHWSKTLAMISPDLPSQLLGMGVGQFPSVKFINSSTAERTATLQLASEGGQNFVRLGVGQALYIEQFVAVQPGQTYQVRLRLRAQAEGAKLGVSICEKWIVASVNCVSETFDVAPGQGEWLTLARPINSGVVGIHRGLFDRPVKLIFQLLGSVPVDLAVIEMLASDNTSILRNGNFSQGLDFWFFTSDQHLAWHAKSMPLALYFDLGVLGLLATASLISLGLVRAARSAIEGTIDAAPVFAALLGFVGVGMFDTLLDTPRFVMLFVLLCCLAATTRRRPDQNAPRRVDHSA